MLEFYRGIQKKSRQMKFAITCTFFACMLVGCASSPNQLRSTGYYANSEYHALSQNDRVRFLVLHYTVADDQRSLKLLTEGNVSSHYLVPLKPTRYRKLPFVYQLVDEDKRAWHAGVSNWQGRTNLNDSSIGIEIVNHGYEIKNGSIEWFPFTPDQISSVAAVAKDIINRYKITPDRVVGHSDIAPGRKQDPGLFFPWKYLAEQGVGAWPDDITVQKYLAGRSADLILNDAKTLKKALKDYGYAITVDNLLDTEAKAVISAFQMHFRPSDISGIPDAETESIALALVEKYRK